MFSKNKNETYPVDGFFLNQNSKLSGDLSAVGLIRIAGEYDGVISGERLLVEETGSVKGKVNVTKAVIKGNVRAELKCSGELNISDTGDLEGNITYGKLIVSLGGRCEGTIQELPEPKTAHVVSSLDAMFPRKAEGQAG
jgi:cytoskeletal protein CcmA (bactofilin family)